MHSYLFCILPVLSALIQTIHRDGFWYQGLFFIGLLLSCNVVMMRIMSRWFCKENLVNWLSIGWLFFWYGLQVMYHFYKAFCVYVPYSPGRKCLFAFLFCFILVLICRQCVRKKVTTKIFHTFSIGWLLFCGFSFVQSLSCLRSTKKLPNVYHIMLRAYSNADHLQRGRTQYNNMPFYHALERKGFVCFPYAVHFQGKVEENVRSILNFGKTDLKALYSYSILKKEVWETLRKLGYRIHFFTNDLLDYHYPNEARSWLSFLRKDHTEYLCFGRKSLVARQEGQKAQLIFEKLQQGIENGRVNNQYFYAHLSQPHRLCFDIHARDFASNVKEVNQWLLAFVETILSQYPENNQPIILLTGTHGRSIGEPEEDFIHSCLFCLYVPEAWRKEAEKVHVNHVYSFLVDHLRKM